MQSDANISTVHDPQEKEADGDFGEHECDEGLDPVGPAHDDEDSALTGLQIVFVAAQTAADDLGCDEAAADQVGGLFKCEKRRDRQSIVGLDR